MSRIKETRRRLGLSQVELAEGAGVSPATVVEIERGHRQPQGRTLRKLAAALGVEVADLVEEVAGPFPKDQAPQLPLEPVAKSGLSPGDLRYPETRKWLEERGLKYTAMGNKEFGELMRPRGIVAPPSRLAELLQKVISETEELDELRRAEELPPGGLTEALRAWERAASRWFNLSAQIQIQAQQAANRAAAS